MSAGIEYKTGDIFLQEADALVNSVNCVGIMGRGIALQFKKAFPDNFKAYANACKREEVQPGRMFVYETRQLTPPRFIINFPTKRHWRGKSRIEDIESGLAALVEEIRERNITSIALPALGTSLGGLEWPRVRDCIEATLSEVGGLRVVVFSPGSSPADDRPNPSTNIPKMTQGRAALVMMMRRYLNGLLDPFVTLLEVHKLMYFLQLVGEPLNLRFQKATYGPYAENLRHVLHAVEGHLISGYADGGDNPAKELELVPGAVDDAAAFLSKRHATTTRLDRVFRLVDGFESSFGLELLSTVHWVAGESSQATDEEVIDGTYAWGERKRQFSERQILLALRVLREQEWL
jgi:O-acetyl-ADP-ribose deacetylase (regulator of RNase III)